MGLELSHYLHQQIPGHQDKNHKQLLFTCSFYYIIFYCSITLSGNLARLHCIPKSYRVKKKKKKNPNPKGCCCPQPTTTHHMTQVNKRTNSTQHKVSNMYPAGRKFLFFQYWFPNIYFLSSLKLLQNQFSQQKTRGHCLFKTALNIKTTGLHQCSSWQRYYVHR